MDEVINAYIDTIQKEVVSLPIDKYCNEPVWCDKKVTDIWVVLNISVPKKEYITQVKDILCKYNFSEKDCIGGAYTTIYNTSIKYKKSCIDVLNDIRIKGLKELL